MARNSCGAKWTGYCKKPRGFAAGKNCFFQARPLMGDPICFLWQEYVDVPDSSVGEYASQFKSPQNSFADRVERYEFSTLVIARDHATAPHPDTIWATSSMVTSENEFSESGL
jgi:hypothetical protein